MKDHIAKNYLRRAVASYMNAGQVSTILAQYDALRLRHDVQTSFAAVLEAYGNENVSTAKTKLDELFEAERAKRYGTERLEWTRERSPAPIDLDELNKPVPNTGRLEKARSDELKQRFNLPNGLVLQTTREVSESNSQSKKVSYESIGSKDDSIFEVSFCLCNAGKVRW